MNDPHPQTFYTISEAARILRISVRTMANLMKSRDPIPFARVGRRVLISRVELIQYVAKRTNRSEEH